MPVAIETPMERVPITELPRKQWTREECQTLQDSGFVELEGYELIEGELVRKVSKSSRHIRALSLLIHVLTRIFGHTVLQEPSILVSASDSRTNLPEPDAVVLRILVEDLADLPSADQIRLVAEVSDTSLRFNLTTRAAHYTRAGIPEFWVVDLNARRIVVLREPREGQYTSVSAMARTKRFIRWRRRRRMWRWVPTSVDPGRARTRPWPGS